MKEYTKQQKAIVRKYEDAAYCALYDYEKWKKIMAEFEEIKKSWEPEIAVALSAADKAKVEAALNDLHIFDQEGEMKGYALFGVLMYRHIETIRECLQAMIGEKA